VNAVTADARIRIVCPSNKPLHLVTGVALEETVLAGPAEYEGRAWFVALDAPTLDGVEFIAVAEEHLVLLAEDWPAVAERAVAMRCDWHVDLPDEQVIGLAPHVGTGADR